MKKKLSFLKNKMSEIPVNPLYELSEEKFDKLSDADYKLLVEKYKLWHETYYSGCSMYVQRRLSPEERQQKHKEFLATLGPPVVATLGK